MMAGKLVRASSDGDIVGVRMIVIGIAEVADITSVYNYASRPSELAPSGNNRLAMSFYFLNGRAVFVNKMNPHRNKTEDIGKWMNLV